MLWDIQDYSRDMWDTALEGNWETKAKPILKNPNSLKYYMSDRGMDRLPLMRFTILGDPIMDDDYGYPMHPVLAIAEFKQFDTKKDPHGWSMPYISIDPALQKVGVARELFRHSLQWLKKNDPAVTLHRTANSATGMHWQHVADTELFAAKIPWTQGERSPNRDERGRVHMNDFESPTARIVDALQRKSAPEVQTLLEEHPGYDWSVPNGAFVHPLHAALLHSPETVPSLLTRGAKPAAEAGWIGRSLIDKHNTFKAWLDCFDEVDQGKAFVLAVAGNGNFFLNEHPVWTGLSQEKKVDAAALTKESGTYVMRSLLGEQPNGDNCWDSTQWNEFADVLVVNTVPSRVFQM